MTCEMAMCWLTRFLLQYNGVVVDWDREFKISDLSAPARAAKGGSGQGKKITGYRLANGAPTQINLPHNSFVRPTPPRVADELKEKYKELREACKKGADPLPFLVLPASQPLKFREPWSWPGRNGSHGYTKGISKHVS